MGLDDCLARVVKAGEMGLMRRREIEGCPADLIKNYSAGVPD